MDQFKIGDVVRVLPELVEADFEADRPLKVVGVATPMTEASNPSSLGTPAGCTPAQPGYVWVFYLRVGYRDSARFAEACYLQLPVVALERVEP